MSNLRKFTNKPALISPENALQKYKEAMGLAAPIAKSKVVILCDGSGSMKSLTAEGVTRWQTVREVLRDIWTDPTNQIVYGVGTEVIRFEAPVNIKRPTGSTNLHGALNQARKHMPTTIIILSDGGPDSPGLAMLEARHTQCPISTVFIGDETDTEAIAFMKNIAKQTGGTTQVKDLKKLLSEPLATTVRKLLP